MDATLATINESQWILCLLQITGLMLIGWIAGRIALHKFPDISASVGAVVLTVSTGLIALTWAGFPRPFELNASDEISIPEGLEPVRLSAEILQSTVGAELSPPSWLNKFTTMINWSAASTSDSETSEGTWQLVTPARIVSSLLMLTLVGGLVGVFRVCLLYTSPRPRDRG